MSKIGKNGVLTSKVFSEIIPNQLYPQFHVEPDGTGWVQVFHHSNPASALFSSTDPFSTYVYLDANRWFYFSLCNLITNNTYEFLVKQAATLGGAETKYRWIQTVNPMTAVYGDVDYADVTHISTSGYTVPSNYGGLFYRASSAYLLANNGTESSWWGATGSWTAYSGGIPGYGSTVVTTGYYDVYLRIDNQVNTKGTSIFNNAVMSKDFIEL